MARTEACPHPTETSTIQGDNKVVKCGKCGEVLRIEAAPRNRNTGKPRRG